MELHVVKPTSKTSVEKIEQRLKRTKLSMDAMLRNQLVERFGLSRNGEGTSYRVIRTVERALRNDLENWPCDFEQEGIKNVKEITDYKGTLSIDLEGPISESFVLSLMASWNLECESVFAVEGHGGGGYSNSFSETEFYSYLEDKNLLIFDYCF